jgi:hypothetical protein
MYQCFVFTRSKNTWHRNTDIKFFKDISVCLLKTYQARLRQFAFHRFSIVLPILRFLFDGSASVSAMKTR